MHAQKGFYVRTIAFCNQDREDTKRPNSPNTELFKLRNRKLKMAKTFLARNPSQSLRVTGLLKRVVADFLLGLILKSLSRTQSQRMAHLDDSCSLSLFWKGPSSLPKLKDVTWASVMAWSVSVVLMVVGIVQFILWRNSIGELEMLNDTS